MARLGRKSQTIQGTTAIRFADDDPRALLASRLAAYASVLLGVRVVSMLGVGIAEQVVAAPQPWWTKPSGLLAIVGACLLVATIVSLRRLNLAPVVLRAIDVVLTLALSAASAYAIVIDTEAAIRDGAILPALASPEVKALTSVSHLLLLRAAIVPSAALPTAVIGMASALIYLAGTWFAWSRAGLVPTAGMPVVGVVVLSSFSVAISTACSAVISGLRRRVREATKLGQYTLEHKLGQGGMGTVYRARHALLRRPTAVKVLLPEHLGPVALARFEREVQVTAGISHPNVVSVYDFGRSYDGTFYYAMEFLDGVDLQKLVDADGPQPAARVVALLRQAAEALAEAHAVQLIHRDIKPANMVVTRRAAQVDVLKLVDFGLVKELSREDTANLTANHQIHGTPLYMAPESILKPESVGARADLYALGAVGYFLLAGSPVFQGETTVAVLLKHVHDPPVPLSERVAGLSKKLESVISRCLAKDPEQRFADARELLRALAECDDVPDWSQLDALTWWQTRRQPLADDGESSPSRKTLAIDFGERLAE